MQPSEYRIEVVDNAAWNAKIRALAERLNVPPCDNSTGQFRCTLAAGDSNYDLVDMINAALDRFDAAIK